MKAITKTKAVMITITCFLLSVHLTAQLNAYSSKLICPEGLSITKCSTDFLIGSAQPHVKYKKPSFNITIPATFPDKEKIKYDELLVSGLNSMLFEYKNYKGKVKNVSYLVFALGNYNVINEYVLSFLNQNIFTNQKLLTNIYEWAKPFYLKVFNELTFEEQDLLKSKIILAEYYVRVSLIENNEIKFKTWLAKSGIKYDEKLTGFLKRRINKKQWSLQECLSWIIKIKNDFPELKNKTDKKSHLQITEQLSSNLNIACNHIGDYVLVDSSYNALTDYYNYIEKIAFKKIYLYNSYRLEDRFCYKLSETGELIKPIDSTWINWFNVNDTIIYYQKNNECGIYNSITNNQPFSSFKDIIFINSTPLLVARKDTFFFIYNYTGIPLCNEKIMTYEVEVINDSGALELVCNIPVSISKDNTLIVFKNQKNKSGVLSKNGKLILPFLYDEIKFSTNDEKIIALDYENNKEILFNRNGKLIERR